MNATVIICMVLMGLFAAATFWFAAAPKPEPVRKYWIIKFLTSDHPDDITFSVNEFQDPNAVASEAIERYCDRTGYLVTEITEMKQISREEFISIRRLLYSKLNDANACIAQN